jgi:putative DNA primase/helicase
MSTTPIEPSQLLGTPVSTPNEQNFKTTELGNAERLAFRHGPSIRYCSEWDTWFIWNNHRWEPDTTGKIFLLAQNTVRSIYGEAEQANVSEIRTKLADHARKSETKYAIESMVSLAKSMLPIRPSDLDGDPFLLNCENVTVDLRTGKCRPHDCRDWLTKGSPVKYDPQATCPVWDRFLNRIFNHNEELIRYLHRVIGYSLTGAVSEKALFMFYGDGDNGKTTLLEAVRYILGDYAGVVEINSLMQKASNSEQQHAIADLKGKRFVTASEVTEGQRFNEAKIKHITGMGRLKGRRMYGHAFEFDPQFKLFIDANHKPLIRETDNAIWNRVRLVPFKESIPKAEQDRDLLRKLHGEAPGILAWAVQGCVCQPDLAHFDTQIWPPC